MYHYDPKVALDELRDDAVLPHPVHLRDMILRTKLDATNALDLNREFQDYLTRFGEAQKLAGAILDRVAVGARKVSASERIRAKARRDLSGTKVSPLRPQPRGTKRPPHENPYLWRALWRRPQRMN